MSPAATGAAYVLIAHGPSGAGAYNRNGVLQAGSVAKGTSELPNANGQPLTGSTSFVAASLDTTVGATHFDDELSHPALGALLASAQLGPRTPH